jgi:hypothetical protein
MYLPTKRPPLLFAFFLGLALLTTFGCKQHVLYSRTAAEKKKEETLSVKVKNITSRTLYVTCFCYLKKKNSPRWHWYKTPVHELGEEQETTISIGHIPEYRTRKNVYGVLGVFTERKKAESAIYELMEDHNKIDLDRIVKIKDNTILIGVEKYGIQGDVFDYDFVPDNQEVVEVPELDFVVYNETGKPVYATAFIYQKKEDMPVWKYDKSPVIRIEPGSQGVIDVDTLTDPYDRKYMRGYLAVFDEAEEQQANQATYQLLKEHQKITLGLLSALQSKKVVLKYQRYGILGDSLKFKIEDTR